MVHLEFSILLMIALRKEFKNFNVLMNHSNAFSCQRQTVEIRKEKKRLGKDRGMEIDRVRVCGRVLEVSCSNFQSEFCGTVSDNISHLCSLHS